MASRGAAATFWGRTDELKGSQASAPPRKRTLPTLGCARRALCRARERPSGRTKALLQSPARPPPNDPARHGALTSSMWGGYYLQKKIGRAPSAHAERALAKQRHFQCHRPSVPGSQHYMGSRKNYYRKQPSRMVLSPVDLRRKQVASSVRKEKETKKKRSGVQE